MRANVFVVLCAVLISLSARPVSAQFESGSDSFEDTVKKVAAPPSTPAPGAPEKSKPMEKFEEAYLDVLRRALNAGGATDADFWPNAYTLVFGDRTNNVADAEKARQLFLAGERVRGFAYVPVTPANPAYVPGREGEKLEADLKAALDRLAATDKPAKEDYLAVVAKLTPFLRTVAAAALAETGGIVIPDGGKLVYDAQPYCLQHNLPGPASGSPMWLIPAKALIPKDALPIFEALLQWSEGHPSDHGIVQSLLWAIRESNEHPYTALTSEQKRVLDAALDKGSDKFLAFMGEKLAAPTVPGGGATARTTDDGVTFGSVNDAAFGQDDGKADLVATKRAIAQNSRANAGIVEHGHDPRDPAQTQAILQALGAASGQARSSSGPKPTDAYTLLAEGIAAQTGTTGLAGGLRTTIYNHSGRTFVFRAQDYVALTRPKTQPFAFTSPATGKVDWVAAKKRAMEIVEQSNLVLQGKYDPTFKAQNPLWDILKHDRGGNLICRVEARGWPDYIEATRVAAKSVVVCVTLFGRDDTEIPAQWNCYDTIEYDTDCHGYSLTGGHFVIGDPDMQHFLEAQRGLLQEVEKLASPQNQLRPGDLIVLHNPTIYRDGVQTVVHSFIALEHDMVCEAAGVVVYDDTGMALRPRKDEQTSNWIRQDGKPVVAPVTKEHTIERVKVLKAWNANDAAYLKYWRPAP